MKTAYLDIHKSNSTFFLDFFICLKNIVVALRDLLFKVEAFDRLLVLLNTFYSGYCIECYDNLTKVSNHDCYFLINNVQNHNNDEVEH